MPGLFDSPQQGGGLLGAGGNIGAGLNSFAHSDALLPAIANMISGFATGQRADPQGMALQQMQSTYDALLKAGAPEHIARAAAQNPREFGQYAQPYLDTAPKVQAYPNPLTGDQQFYAQTGGAHPSVTAMSVGGAGGAGAPGGETASGLFNKIAEMKAAGAPRSELLKLIPEGSGLRESVGSMLEGGVIPTNFSMRGAARDLALKIGHAIDDNFNELEIPGRKKMFTDLSSSSQGSMGGILSNGKSALGHLADLSDKFTGLGNYNYEGFPGAGTAANVVNTVGNTLGGSGTKGKIAATKDNLLKYGEESTKFYSATGGGEGERTYALKNLNPNSVSGEEAAGYLQTERDLMDRRMTEKEAQVRNTLGPSYLERHPVRDADYNKTLARIDANIAKLKSGQQQPATAQTAPAQGAPQPGTVMKGYRFKGGNPADQNSWEKVQ